MKTKARDLYDLADDNQGDEPCQENEKFGFTFHETSLEDDDIASLHAQI